jgi:hypothetical protein
MTSTSNSATMPSIIKFDTPYVFYAFNKKKNSDMKIQIIFTKITKTYIYYHYNQIEKETGIYHPTITTKSKYIYRPDNNHEYFKFEIRNKDYELYSIYVSFIDTSNSNRHLPSVLYLYNDRNFIFRPVRYIVKSDIRRYVDNLRKRLNAKKTIVEYWCRARYNPEYEIGRRYAMDNYYEDILGIPAPPHLPLPPIPVQ